LEPGTRLHRDIRGLRWPVFKLVLALSITLPGITSCRSARERDPYHAVVEVTVQRARPVALTALAAVLAFILLTFSAFWGPMAYTLIGGTAAGTILTLVFLPALYAIWFKIRPTEDSTIRVREVIPRMQRRVGGEVA